MFPAGRPPPWKDATQNQLRIAKSEIGIGCCPCYHDAWLPSRKAMLGPTASHTGPRRWMVAVSRARETRLGREVAIKCSARHAD